MRTISISNSILSNESVANDIEEQGIILTCNDDMDIEISDEDYEKLCNIIDPADIIDIEDEKQIETLSELADYINAHDEWVVDCLTIIEANGWHDETDQEFGVCSTETERVIINERGYAQVVPNDDHDEPTDGKVAMVIKPAKYYTRYQLINGDGKTESWFKEIESVVKWKLIDKSALDTETLLNFGFPKWFAEEHSIDNELM